MTDEEKLKKAYSNTIQDNPKYSRKLYDDEKKRTKLELYFAILLCLFAVVAIVLLVLNNLSSQNRSIKIFFLINFILTIIFAVIAIVVSIRDGNKGIRSPYIKFAMSAAFLAVPIVAILGVLLLNN